MIKRNFYAKFQGFSFYGESMSECMMSYDLFYIKDKLM